MPSLRLPLRSRRALSPPPLLLLLALLAPAPTAALDNGVGRLPAMGWSSWNTFRCDISAELVLQVADALVASGLASAGYRYVHVDDCWMTAQRGADGHLQVDKTKFPLGMRALGDELHARGLLFGIYSAVRGGRVVCEGGGACQGARESALTRACVRLCVSCAHRRATRRARATPRRGATRPWTPRTSPHGASTRCAR